MNEKTEMIWRHLQYIDDVPEDGLGGFDEFIHDKLDSRLSEREFAPYIDGDEMFNLNLTAEELDYLWKKFIDSFEEDPYCASRLEDDALARLEDIRQ